MTTPESNQSKSNYCWLSPKGFYSTKGRMTNFNMTIHPSNTDDSTIINSTLLCRCVYFRRFHLFSRTQHRHNCAMRIPDQAALIIQVALVKILSSMQMTAPILRKSQVKKCFVISLLVSEHYGKAPLTGPTKKSCRVAAYSAKNPARISVTATDNRTAFRRKSRSRSDRIKTVRLTKRAIERATMGTTVKRVLSDGGLKNADIDAIYMSAMLRTFAFGAIPNLALFVVEILYKLPEPDVSTDPVRKY